MSPWIVYALLASLFAALVAVLGKVGVKNVDPTLATAVRATVMMVFLVTVAAVTGKAGGVGDIDRRSLVFILLSGLAGAASWLFYFVALREGPASGVAALDRTSVALVFVLAVMFLGETFTWKESCSRDTARSTALTRTNTRCRAYLTVSARLPRLRHSRMRAFSALCRFAVQLFTPGRSGSTSWKAATTWSWNSFAS